MIICQNCGSAGNQKYCPGCGQPLLPERISIHYLLHEVAHTFWHLEKGFIYTERIGYQTWNRATKIFIRYPVALSKAVSIVCYFRNLLCICLIFYLSKCSN